MHLVGIDHVGIAARDVARSEAFYREVLGLRPADGPPGHPRMLEAGALRLAITPLRDGEDGAAARAFGEHLALAVAVTPQALAARLDGLGIPHQLAGARVYLRDPDGHVLELVCARADL